MNGTATKVIAPSLNEIVKYSVRALLRRPHLNRDVITGLLGERGSGKSLGGANIFLRDGMFAMEPGFSNMQIKTNVKVPDAVAQYCGLSCGGMATYEAEHIEKQAFLALDSRYEGGHFFFDEFNLEYGEARRSSSNVNLKTDRAIQQLRKLQCSLTYTVLNEMYVDTRIRDNTDLFIRCSDVAFKPMNLSSKMRQGVVFEWLLYPMSSRIFGVGNTYKDTGKAIGPLEITLGNMWGVIDTYERQASGQANYTEKEKVGLIPVEMTEDPVVIKERDAWGWLDKKLADFWENHADDGAEIEIRGDELRQELGVPVEGWPRVAAKLTSKFSDWEVRGSNRRYKKYIIPNRVLV